MGFHTDDYCLNFVDCCQRILGCQLQRQKMLVQHHGRVIQVKALPIGIPYSQFESFSLTAPTVYGENNSQKVRTKKSVLQTLVTIEGKEYKTRQTDFSLKDLSVLIDKHRWRYEHFTSLG